MISCGSLLARWVQFLPSRVRLLCMFLQKEGSLAGTGTVLEEQNNFMNIKKGKEKEVIARRQKGKINGQPKNVNLKSGQDVLRTCYVRFSVFQQDTIYAKVFYVCLSVSKQDEFAERYSM